MVSAVEGMQTGWEYSYNAIGEYISICWATLKAVKETLELQ